MKRGLSIFGISLFVVSTAMGQHEKAIRNYQMYCSACHGAKLELDKPNSLIKSVWKNGGTKDAILQTITNGVVNTQMIPWKGVLKPEEIEELSNYIISLQKK